MSPVPAGQYGGPVSSLDGIPYSTGFLGTNQVTQVLQNNGTLGNASIDILGPYWSSSSGIIEGQYPVVLQPGRDSYGNDLVSASISQTNLVPTYSQSLQFKAQTFSPFTVSLCGQTLALRITWNRGELYPVWG